MKLKLKGELVEIKTPAVMGTLVLDAEREFVLEAELSRALKLIDEGADFIEVGVREGTLEQELELLPPLVQAVARACETYIAVTTVYPEVIRRCCENGAALVISPDSLKMPGALETVCELKLPVCLMCGGAVAEEEQDPTAALSEHLYERLDACLNAGIPRSRILIDPSPGVSSSFELRLKAIGRLHTYKSFALPLALAVPRALPEADQEITDHPGVYTAVALFAVESGVSIIRTEYVQEVALAIETHLACTKSAKPTKLIKALMKALKKRREARREKVS